MLIFRPVSEDDLQALLTLADTAGVGLTTLPQDLGVLKNRIEHSLISFDCKCEAPKNENYFFVLEDSETNRVVGTSAIEAAVGYSLPFYSYLISNKTHINHELNLRVDLDLLNCVNDFQGCTEIGSLFLLNDYRKDGNGLLLSRARFLFISNFLDRFSDWVIAEMRGVSDSDGNSPFWDAVGKHFFKMSFSKADNLSVKTNKQFIADLMPHHPIYVDLLGEKAKAVIGKPHRSTLPAMKILEREGFYYNRYVDIFDAGPMIACKKTDILSVKSSQHLKVKKILDNVKSSHYFLLNNQLDFRAVQAPAMLNDDGVIISREVAKALKIEEGEGLSLIPIRY